MTTTYLKKLTVTGPNRYSEINFREGLNIITGPSNVGKTCIVKCIDYLTGSLKHPFSSSTDYNTVNLEISVGDRVVKLSRELGKDTVFVNSNFPKINSGEYYSKHKSNNKNPISDVWLQLFGIEPPVEVISNKLFRKQKLSIRTFISSWIIHENEMNKSSSILLPRVTSQVTAYLSSLLYLLYEKDFSKIKKQESVEERKIRHNSVKNYIYSKINQFNEEQDRLISKLNKKSESDIYAEIEELSNKLENLSNVIYQSNNIHSNLLQQLADVDTQLSEKSLLLNRFKDLASQYESDFNRLSFIIESHTSISTIKNSGMCPICNNELPSDSARQHVDSFETELDLLVRKIKSLNQTRLDLKKDFSLLQEQKEELELQRIRVADEINNILIPDEKKLTFKIEQYKSYIKAKSVIETINRLVENWNQDIDDLENEHYDKVEYFPKDEFPSQFWHGMTKNIQSILKQCSFEKYGFSRFDSKEFDIEIMGENKINRYGKGYISYLNTVVVLALRKLFFEQAKFKPFFHIIDTPLLGLDEGEKNNTPESMRIALFEYFSLSAQESQLIVIENSRNLPKFRNFDCNFIEFTKSYNNGRYGFLEGVNDK